MAFSQYHSPSQPESLKWGEVKNCYYIPVLTAYDRSLPIYLANMGIALPERYIIRDANFPCSQIIFCTQGQGILELKGQKHVISPGMGFTLSAGQPHSYHPLTEDWTNYFLAFRGAIKKRILPHPDTVFSVTDLPLLLERFYHLINIPAGTGWSDSCSAALYQFLITFHEAAEFHDVAHIPSVTAKERLAPIVRYLSQNISQPFDLTQLAALAEITPTHLCRLFKEAFSMRPSEYANSVKIQYAQQMLEADPTLKVELLSEATGFSNKAYFFRQFKKFVGVTPGQYRSILCPNETSEQ